MAKVTPITEQFQHFVRDLKESFWGDLYGKTRRAWERFWEEESRRARDRYLVAESYERVEEGRRGYRNGYYERDFVTRLGTLRVRVARSRERSFRPPGLERFQRRAPEVLMLIREAFLRGISTRQVGRVVGIVTGEVISAQTVSKITRSLDRLVKAFQQARLKDEWVYLFLDGVSLRVRRPAGRQRVQMLVAYGVRADGSRQLLGFLRSRGESQAAWEGLLEDLYRRGLKSLCENSLHRAKRLGVGRYFISLWSFSVSRGSIFSSGPASPAFRLPVERSKAVSGCTRWRPAPPPPPLSPIPAAGTASDLVVLSAFRTPVQSAPCAARKSPFPPGRAICAASADAPGPWPGTAIAHPGSALAPGSNPARKHRSSVAPKLSSPPAQKSRCPR